MHQSCSPSCVKKTFFQHNGAPLRPHFSSLHQQMGPQWVALKIPWCASLPPFWLKRRTYSKPDTEYSCSITVTWYDKRKDLKRSSIIRLIIQTAVSHNSIFFLSPPLEILDIQRRWTWSGSSLNHTGLKSNYCHTNTYNIAASRERNCFLYDFQLVIWFCCSLDNTVTHSQWESI